MTKELKNKIEDFFKEKGIKIQLQLWTFLDAMIQGAGEEGIFWEPTREMVSLIYLNFPEDSDLKPLIQINRLFLRGWEVILVTSHSWFEDGGAITDVLIAKKKALRRIQETFISKGVPFPGSLYWKDQESHPEDYRIFSSYPF